MMPLRLRRVAGFEGRLNDTLFQPAANLPTQQTLVFFGGDVQDYPEIMQAHRDNRNYLKWNLENTARMLGHTFPNKHILVVRPSRIEYKSFSCYDNFVPNNNAGVPEHTPTHNALHHLEIAFQGGDQGSSLLVHSLTPLSNASIHHQCGEQSKSNGAAKGHTSHQKPETDFSKWKEKLSLEGSRLTLVGFSKGCVVLNQLLYEFHYTHTLTPGDSHMMRFIQRIDDMYWLDGGHAGGKNTWITSRSLLETLTRLNMNIFIHVSPYQVLDEGRPWIGREEKAFTGMLKKLGAKVQRYLHDQPGMTHSLHMHFEVLANFKRVQDSVPSHLSDSSDEDT
ncbi:hypothetical protein K1T71_006468 [Dendrolimus kikuchii]|uniref:Uncharacterized protein n=1 Tax=Dendrolimus kikuchii TaxID=765133 RepID=A0ACC1D186_9NEOP|nr:hypothetical protein K1T71_006468 [Dendrolimus kikuchii]